jgi:hypothetical protein
MTDDKVQPEEIIARVINDAEAVIDPLDGLVERTRGDVGAPFEAEVLGQLGALKAEDFAAYESLRGQLRKAGCRVGKLDKALGDSESANQQQIDLLLQLASAAEMFHSADDDAYADVSESGHRENYRIEGKKFRRWLTLAYYRRTGSAPSSEAFQAALNTIVAKAQFDGPERNVYVRVGAHAGRLYLDLGDPTWRAVEIDASGWRPVDNPPVRFRRASGMKALPVPLPGGSIKALRQFLNVSASDFVLIVAYLLAGLRERGPYPVLVLVGEQGTAKTTHARLVRALVDPNTASLRALPREERDLFIAATNGHLLAFDNVSNMPAWLSDALCRIATGGGFAVRQLYKDQDEVLFDATRPIILTGIQDFVTRPDLVDRSIFVTLEPIPEECRREERELEAAFEAERPLILGALLDAVAKGLARLPETKLQRLPRMADFAVWATACETAFWPPGTFLTAYNDNRHEAMTTVIEGDTVGVAIQKMMAGRPERTPWTGTATTLLKDLNALVGEETVRSKGWPANASALGGRLREVAPSLRDVGFNIKVDNRKGKRRNRMIEIAPILTAVEPENAGLGLSALSALSATGSEAAASLGFAPPQERTCPADGRTAADRQMVGADGTAVRHKPPDGAVLNEADGADSKIPPPFGAPAEVKPRWRARA